MAFVLTSNIRRRRWSLQGRLTPCSHQIPGCRCHMMVAVMIVIGMIMWKHVQSITINFAITFTIFTNQQRCFSFESLASKRCCRIQNWAQDLDGPVFLRPWMLAWRADYGLAGMAEPDEFTKLVELVATSGFRTNSDIPGVEKLAVCEPTKEWLNGANGGLERLPALMPNSFTIWI